MKNITYIIIILFTLYSCIKPIDDLEIEEKDPRIVMSGMLYPDSIIKVHLSRSISILDKEEITPILNAIVEVWNENALIETLQYDYENDIYISSNPLQKEKNITLRASADGYNSVSSHVTIPDKTPIISVDTAHITNLDENQYYDPYNPSIVTTSDKILEMKIKFSDPADQTNYYMFEIRNSNTIINSYWDEQTYEYIPIDTVKVNNLAYFESSDPVFEICYDFNSIFAVSQEEDVYYGGAVFSDKLINGKTHTINLKIYNLELGNYIQTDSIDILITLISINEDYYKLLRSLSIYSDDPFDSFFTERVSVYTNVNNGYGLVGGAAPYIYHITYPIDTTYNYYK